MRKFKSKKTKTKVVSDIICDSCGKSCKIPKSLTGLKKIDAFEFMDIDVHWGYFSNHDTEHWTAQICEKCVDEKFKFIKFKKTNYL